MVDTHTLPSLRAAIRADPNNHFLTQIYADALEEDGQAVAALFRRLPPDMAIRLEPEMLPSPSTTTSRTPHRSKRHSLAG